MKRGSSRMTSVLKHGGYRLTPQRRSVLNAITLSHEHLSPAGIWEKVRHEHPGIGLVTVYRTLDILTRLGLICEMRAGGSCRSYLLRRPEHHHHLICSGCGKVVDFTGCGLDGLEQRLVAETGFTINEHRLEVYGECRNCVTKSGL